MKAHGFQSVKGSWKCLKNKNSTLDYYFHWTMYVIVDAWQEETREVLSEQEPQATIAMFVV